MSQRIHILGQCRTADTPRTMLSTVEPLLGVWIESPEVHSEHQDTKERTHLFKVDQKLSKSLGHLLVSQIKSKFDRDLGLIKIR